MLQTIPKKLNVLFIYNYIPTSYISIHQKYKLCKYLEYKHLLIKTNYFTSYS